MFGNLLGWIISAVLALLMAVLLFWIAKLDTISPPSRGVVVLTQRISLDLPTRPELLEPIKFPADPLSVLPGMTDPADAAPFYRKAIAAYDADKWAYEPNSKTGILDSEDLPKLPGVAAVMDAANCSKMNLFVNDLDNVISYRDLMNPAPIEKLSRVGKACMLLGLSRKADRDKAVRENRTEDAEKLRAQALRFYEASFSLGYKLCTERVRWPEFDAGWTLMISSAIGMERVDPSRAPAKAFADACTRYYADQIKPLFAVIPSIDPGVIGRTAGDVFYVAKYSKERMWRVEAVLKLGRYRFDSGEGGRGADQRWANIWLRRMADNPNEDPVVREAAKKARDLTHEEYRMIH